MFRWAATARAVRTIRFFLFVFGKFRCLLFGLLFCFNFRWRIVDMVWTVMPAMAKGLFFVFVFYYPDRFGSMVFCFWIFRHSSPMTIAVQFLLRLFLRLRFAAHK